MAIRKGYKETEIGIIPIEWDIAKIEKNKSLDTDISIYIGKVKSGKRLPKGYLVTETPTNYPYIRVLDMKMGKIDTSKIMYVPEKAFSAISNYRIFSDDIYISVAGTLGIVGAIPLYLDGANLTENANRITNIKCNKRFLMYWLMSGYIKNEIESSQTIGAQPKLALERIRNFLVPSPPPQEQKEIANALSDIDTLIENLEKLIEKKQNIKQGAMEDLLTGKKRLEGFSGKWNEINMSKESKVKARIGWQGLTTNEYLDEGFSYLITGTDFNDGRINWHDCHYVTRERYVQDTNIQIQNDDILITKDGTIGKVALVDGLYKPATLNSGVFVVRPLNKKYDVKFLFYVLTSSIFIEFLDKLTAGSTITHLYQKDLVNFVFNAPLDLKEQETIAKILYDMDAELSQLQEKLLKYQQIKVGMMEELLTGKIRLIATPSSQKANEKAKNHNQQFDDAVMLTAIVDKFYNPKFPLGRKKMQKLLYLVGRKNQHDTTAFHKHAAGPYADSVRYKGGESIARKSGYIDETKTNQGSSFSKGKNIDKALAYITEWDREHELNWLVDNFRYTKVNELEVLATVDMAICDLKEQNKAISVDNIIELLKNEKEWVDKLKKDYFSYKEIEKAITKLNTLFGTN